MLLVSLEVQPTYTEHYFKKKIVFIVSIMITITVITSLDEAYTRYLPSIVPIAVICLLSIKFALR